MFGVQVSHVLVCRKISFNCTLIAHENVTTEFFFVVAVWGNFILLYSELFIFIFHKFCLVVFIASEDMGPSKNVSPLEEFSLCFISDTTLRRWPAYRSQFHRQQTPLQEFRSNTLK